MEIGRLLQIYMHNFMCQKHAIDFLRLCDSNVSLGGVSFGMLFQRMNRVCYTAK